MLVILKPMYRGEIHCIVPQLLNEYRNILKRMVLLNEDFKVLISEPDVLDTITILGLKNVLKVTTVLIFQIRH